MQKKRKSPLPQDSAAVLDRVCEAYGFTTSLQLAEHLEMAASSMSARRSGSTFPADIVVQCCLETGANLNWIAKGCGGKFDKSESSTMQLPFLKLVDGQLFEAGHVVFDPLLFRPGLPLPTTPLCLQDEKEQHVIDKDFSEVYDGKWLVNIEGKISIRSIVRIPVKKVRVTGNGMSFDCALEDIEIIGRVIMTITN